MKNGALVLFLFLVGCGDNGVNGHADYVLPGVIVTIAGTGTAGFAGDRGPALSAQLNMPTDVTVGPTGDLVVVDSGNHRIRTISGEVITTLVGTGNTTGEGAVAFPVAVAWRGTDFFVASWADHRVYQYGSMAGRSVLAGTGEAWCDTSAVAEAATIAMSWPRSIGVLEDGGVVIAEQGCQRVRVVDNAGMVRAFAGTGEAGYSGDDGFVIDAVFANSSPEAGSDAFSAFGFALSPENPPDEMYIADTANHVIREVNLFSGKITTFAGSGAVGFSDGSPLRATFNRPTAVFVAEDHSVWVADTGNHAIRRVDPLQIQVETVVGRGTAGYNGDGIAADKAQLDHPAGLHVTGDGVLYIADSGNHRLRRVVLPGYGPLSD